MKKTPEEWLASLTDDEAAAQVKRALRAKGVFD